MGERAQSTEESEGIILLCPTQAYKRTQPDSASSSRWSKYRAIYSSSPVVLAQCNRLFAKFLLCVVGVASSFSPLPLSPLRISVSPTHSASRSESLALSWLPLFRVLSTECTKKATPSRQLLLFPLLHWFSSRATLTLLHHHSPSYFST